jgi:wyosine [tRNA(Phe)-imidazoG37] synthetase (radical SAM superfamily)
MSHFDYNYLFGPVPSRRFGRSLGIDLTPHKTCSLDCVFCQLGQTPKKTLRREVYIPTRDVIAEIGRWMKEDGNADYLTLSGSGEPTLHAQFGDVLDFLVGQPIPSVLLTNGTLFTRPEVRASAQLADVVKVSLSAWDQPSFEWVNRPHADLQFDQVVAGIQRFREEFSGQLWIEVFLLAGINANAADVVKISHLAKSVRPDRIHLNTITRPPAENFAAAVAIERLEGFCSLFTPPALIATGFHPKRSRKAKANETYILSMLKRRPCTIKQIEDAFDMHINEVSKTLGQLIHKDLVTADLRGQEVYYMSV